MAAYVYQCVVCGRHCRRYPGQMIGTWRVCRRCLVGGWHLERGGRGLREEVWCCGPGEFMRRAAEMRGYQSYDQEFSGDIVAYIEGLEKEGGEE